MHGQFDCSEAKYNGVLVVCLQLEFAELRAAQSKWEAVDGICAQLEALDAKLTEQATRIDQVQMKVNLRRAGQGSTRASARRASGEATDAARVWREFVLNCLGSVKRHPGCHARATTTSASAFLPGTSSSPN